MGFDDLCNTGLVLGLGFSSSTIEIKSKKPFKNLHYQPSLTLSLTGENYDLKAAGEGCGSGADDNHLFPDFYRQDSAASSFSNVSVKREREIGSDKVEIERVSSRANDEDNDKSKKLRLTKAQSALLEDSFKKHSTLNPKQKQDLARELKLRPRQVEVWFQNHRARTKLKQTEVDCEFLKKCCETLTDENRRLQKELQQLKSLKLAQPLCMQLPAATLSICPSCERNGSGDNTAAKNSYVKPHFYNPFSYPSAAC